MNHLPCGAMDERLPVARPALVCVFTDECSAISGTTDFGGFDDGSIDGGAIGDHSLDLTRGLELIVEPAELVIVEVECLEPGREVDELEMLWTLGRNAQARARENSGSSAGVKPTGLSTRTARTTRAG